MGVLTDAQEDALARLRKRHKRDGDVEVFGKDPLDRLRVIIPGEGSPRRRRRAITPTGLVIRPTDASD